MCKSWACSGDVGELGVMTYEEMNEQTQSYTFFHWHCLECYQFGGTQLPSDTPLDEVLDKVKRRHRDENCSANEVELE